MRQRSRIKRLEKTIPASTVESVDTWPPLLRILHAATVFDSHLEPKDRSAGVTAHLVLGLIRGMRTVTDLIPRLLSAIEKSSVDVQPQAVVEKLLLNGKSVNGVQVLRTSNKYNCQTVLSGLPLAQMLDLIPLANRQRRARQTADSVRAYHSLFTINLIVPEERLPLGMGRQVLLVQDADQALLEDNLIRLLCIPMPERKGRVIVNLSCVVPSRKSGLGREYLGPMQQNLLRAATLLIPFLEENLEGLSSPFWESRASDTGHPNPWSLHQTLETEQPAVLGMGLMPMQSDYRNLMMCGIEVVPGLGLEGEAYAAEQMVRTVAESQKLKKVL